MRREHILTPEPSRQRERDKEKEMTKACSTDAQRTHREHILMRREHILMRMAQGAGQGEGDEESIWNKASTNDVPGYAGHCYQ